MRLIIIIICGAALIGAAWAYNQNQESASEKFEEVYHAPAGQITRKTVSKKIVTSPAKFSTLALSADANDINKPLPEQIQDATTIDRARMTARSTLGKADPFADINGPLKPFPGGTQASVTTSARRVDQAAHAKIPGPVSGFVPPPPPMSQPGYENFSSSGAANYLPSGLTPSDLPEPPERPSTARQLKLTAIVGDRAIFAARDLATRRNNNWPGQITLAPGDMFGTVKLISTGRDGALVEEHGERFEIELPPVR